MIVLYCYCRGTERRMSLWTTERDWLDEDSLVSLSIIIWWLWFYMACIRGDRRFSPLPFLSAFRSIPTMSFPIPSSKDETLRYMRHYPHRLTSQNVAIIRLSLQSFIVSVARATSNLSCHPYLLSEEHIQTSLQTLFLMAVQTLAHHACHEACGRHSDFDYDHKFRIR